MNMLGKLKAAAAAAQDAVAEKAAEGQAFVQQKLDEAREAEEAKWRAEVLVGDEQALFKDYEGWEAVYDPQSEGSASQEGQEAGMVSKALVGKLADTIRERVVRLMMTVVGKLLGPVSEGKFAPMQKEIGAAINAANGAVLSHAFAPKLSTKKAVYFRKLAADRLAVALIQALNSEAAVSGVEMGQEIDAVQLKQLVDSVSGKVMEKVEAQKALALETIKTAPLFVASGMEEEQVDAGVVALQGFLQSYLESKVGVMLATLQVVLGGLLELVAKHKDAICKQMKDKQGSPDFEEASKELGAVMDKAHADLTAAVGKYVDDLLVLATGVTVPQSLPTWTLSLPRFEGPAGD